MPSLLALLTAHLDCINEARELSVEVVVSGLKELRKDYLEGRGGCNFECTAIHLGALTMSMRQLKIDDRVTMENTTILELVKGLKEMQSPRWQEYTGGYSPYQTIHSCPDEGTLVESTAFELNEKNGGGGCNSVIEGTLNRFAARLVQRLKDSLVGLELSDFQKVCPKIDMLF